MQQFVSFLIMPGGWEWIVIVLAILLLFGGRKIPELMKGLGQGMKEFKNARNESASDKKKETNDQEKKDHDKSNS